VPLLKSAVAPLALTSEISAFSEIRKVRREAALLETFFRVKTALTAKFLSVSACGKVAAMSYFCTCQVIEARLSSCAGIENVKVRNKKAKIIDENLFIIYTYQSSFISS
jgi:hypothetical protein